MQRMTDSTSPMIHALCEARRNASATDASAFSSALKTEAEAYAVQRGVADALKLLSTPVPRHWKSGGASRDAVLTHAPLADAGVWQSPATARSWHFQHRIMESEIALRLGVDVSAQMAAEITPESAHELIDAMTVAIEMVDTRWQQPLESLSGLHKLADMGVHGALVLGEWVAYERRDWRQQRCTTRIGDREVEHTGTHPLADPAWLLPQWLAHVTQHYGTVPAGTVVTTGNWVGLQLAKAGDLIEVAFDGVGRISLRL